MNKGAAMFSDNPILFENFPNINALIKTFQLNRALIKMTIQDVFPL